MQCLFLDCRFTTSVVNVDYHTVGASDKFGNVFVLQTPDGVNDDIDNPSGQRALWDQGLLNGAPSKLEVLTHYHLGEAVTAMTKCSLVPGGRSVIVTATIMGGIYAFAPMVSKEDVEFFQHLEMYMRQEWPSLCKRDHLSYRYVTPSFKMKQAFIAHYAILSYCTFTSSYYNPVRFTVDGDICERYGAMPYSKQKELADDLNRTPAEVLKKLEETRNLLL